MRLNNSVFAIMAALAAFTAHAADDWPAFRGPDGQGHSAATALPVVWSEQQNIAWKSAVPGAGWSSPVISDGEIWLTTAIEAEFPDAGTAPSLFDYRSATPAPGTHISPKPISMRALCFDLASGTLKRNIEVFFIKQPGNIQDRNTYATPSPVIEKGGVYVHFGTYGTAAISTSDGKVVWRNQDLKLEHANGPGGSPALYKDKLLICCDGWDAQYIVALNKATGQIAWKTDRSAPMPTTLDGKQAYGTPLIINTGGTDQVITVAANAVYGYEPDTGKELWQLRYKGYSNAAQPVYDGKLLFICTGDPFHEMLAFQAGHGVLGNDKIVWRNKVQIPRQSSPVLSDNRLYMLSDSGVARCLDATSGREFWRQHLASDVAPSLLAAAGKIYLFDASENATVIEDSDTLKLFAKNKLDDGCMASPAVVGNSLIIRTKKNLYRIQIKAR